MVGVGFSAGFWGAGLALGFEFCRFSVIKINNFKNIITLFSVLQLFLTFFQKLSCQIMFLCCNIFIKSFHKKIPRKELKKIFFDKFSPFCRLNSRVSTKNFSIFIERANVSDERIEFCEHNWFTVTLKAIWHAICFAKKYGSVGGSNGIFAMITLSSFSNISCSSRQVSMSPIRIDFSSFFF